MTMLKKILPLLIVAPALCLCQFTTRANDIEPTKEFYNATRIPKPIALDGVLSEWAGVPVLADPKFSVKAGAEGTAAGKGSGTNGVYVLFERYAGGDWTGPDDHTSAVQVAWDADNVYFGFVVTDEYHQSNATSDATAWNGDSVQLMIASADRTAQVALYNYALGGAEGALGDVYVHHEAGPGGTEGIVTRNATTKKTIYEIKLPASSLGLTAPLQAGTRFGLGMAINDGDELTPGQKGWGGLGAHSIVFGKTPAQTALITLTTNAPGVDRIFFSAINPSIGSFTFRATDKGASIVSAASAKLTIDGSVVPLTSTKTGDATDFTYIRATQFPPGSDHTYAIEVKDTQANTVTSSGTFKTITFDINANFNDGKVPTNSAVGGTANVKATGSYDGSGYLELTANAISLSGSLVYPDVLSGTSVSSFTALFKMFVGRGSGNPADGFSFNLASDVAADPSAPPSISEEGVGSGLTIAFDTYDNGGAEAPAIGVKFEGTEFVKTNVTKATLVNNKWTDVIVQLFPNGTIDVYYDNVKYINKEPIPNWAPIPTAQLGLGARTGNEFEAHWVDDLRVVFNNDVAIILNEKPTVAITSPADNATFAAGASITVQVRAQDKEGQIAKVEFFANSAKLGESTNAPYSFTVPNVPAGAYSVVARITDALGASSDSPPIKVVVGTVQSILFVTADPGPLTFAGDQAVYEHLLGRGYNVKLTTGTAVPDDGSAANGNVLVIQSSSLGSGTTVAAAGGSKFKNITIPVLEWESSNLDDFGFQEANGTATGADQTQINIVDASSQLAAGFPVGLRTVVTSPQIFSQGTPVGARVVARNAADATQALLFYYEKGDKGFADFVMPARRVFFFFQDNTATAANADGWKLFDASMDWLLGKSSVTPSGARLTVTRSGTQLTIAWTNGGTLQSTTSLVSPITWTDVAGASPQVIDSKVGTTRYFRVKQ
jgi:hypothetical protein